MCFKDIYMKVEELKDHSISTILDNMNIDVIYQECMPLGKQAVALPENNSIVISNILPEQNEKNILLHEIGHLLFDKRCTLANHRTEENNANIFMCLYLIHNEIWDSDYFDTYLIYNGVQPKIARRFNDSVWQFKNQQILEHGYSFSVFT